VCRGYRFGRFRVASTEPARSCGIGNRLDGSWLRGLDRNLGSGLQRLQGFRPAFCAEQGAQAGTDFVFQTGFEPIEAYTINALLAGSAKHSYTH
jgi:hypothetical protein